MNPRQKRGLVLIVVSVLVAIGTFVAVTRYVNNVNSQLGSRVTVYRATKPIDAYTPLTRQNLSPVEVPARWASSSTVLRLTDLEGRRVGFRIDPGTTVSRDMLIPTTSLQRNEREIAINVDAVTGVAGRVRTGDKVDIYAVFAEVPGLPKQSRVLVRNARIVSVAGQQTISQKGQGGLAEKDVIPVTLALQPGQAMSVTYAAAFAQEVRLVALPNDVGTDRNGEKDAYDAGQLGGKPVPEKGDQ